VFPKRHTLLVVIHAESEKQALRNVKIAFDEGADGVFLINHSISAIDLLCIHSIAKRQFPDFWIGLNFLDLDHWGALVNLPGTDTGLWVDYGGIRPMHSDPTRDAIIFSELRKKRMHTGIYFGGVAFKGQATSLDPASDAKLSAPFIDVVTTSGAGTGIAASVQKIKVMKEAIGSHPLALASGVTPNNVEEYLPYIDFVLVSTGVSDSHEETNPELLRELVRKIKSWSE